jgi:vitamin B12 transporter
MSRFIKSRILSCLLLSTTALPGAPAFAAPAEEMIITATRTPQPMARIGSSVSAVDTGDIERRQAVFAHDVLATLPGVVVNQNGPLGGTATVRIRGMLSEQTLVLIDGVTVNDPASPGSGFNFAHLDLNDVERVEVLRGSQSTLYGSDAIGGVINIITKRGGPGVHLNGYAEGGSFATFRGGATLKGASGGFDYRLSLSGITSDGISRADKRDGNTEKDGYEAATLSGNVGYAFNDMFRLEGNVRYSDSTAETDSYGDITGVADGDEESKAKELNAHSRGIITLFDGKFENIVTLSHMKIDRENFLDGVSNYGGVGKRDAVEYQGNVRFMDEVTLTFGAKHEETRIRTATENADVTIKSLYAQVQVLPLNALSLVGGVRADDHETFGTATTARFTAAYQIEEIGTTLRGSWGEGFKAPTPFQLTFFCCGAPGPNINLQPEESRGWDMGIEQALWNERGSLSLTYYRQTSKNLIGFAFPDGYVNINRARSKGVEASLRLAVTPWAQVQASYTRTLAIDRATGMQFNLIPKDEGSVVVDFVVTERFGVAVEGRYTGKKQDTYGIVDDWVRADVRVRYKLNDTVELYGRVENLFDKHYQETFGYGTPGISAYGGVRAAF